jgi:zinc transporter ZupT
MAFTGGLLVFLGVEALSEAFELQALLPSALGGSGLVLLGVALSFLGMTALAGRLSGGGTATGLALALLVAIGIGVHNLGEGLAIGAAFALGEAGLGALLILGFTLHNTTEGLAIVAPLARESSEGSPRPRIADLLVLGLIGGAPTIAGAWIGGFLYSGVWPTLFLAIGVGAILQVVVQIARQTLGERPLMTYLTSPAVAAGLAVGFLVMYATGMIIG